MSICKVRICFQSPSTVSSSRRSPSSVVSCSHDLVSVKITNGPRNSRFVLGSLFVQAPIEALWSSLTDYDHLDEFIPSLVKNECLERKSNGAILKQVGQQNIALGVKFCATAVLEIGEHLNGLCRDLTWSTNNSAQSWDEYGCFPTPDTRSGSRVQRDITFNLIKGDFQSFKGLWRMQDVVQDPSATHLSYSLFIRPQLWLPVNLIQGRISKETKNNLLAVKSHAENLSLVS